MNLKRKEQASLHKSRQTGVSHPCLQIAVDLRPEQFGLSVQEFSKNPFFSRVGDPFEGNGASFR